jgi:predicted DNA-binding protein (UPF0251 family)
MGGERPADYKWPKPEPAAARQKKVMKIAILSLVAAAAALGQSPRPIALFPPELKAYLGLTDAQTEAISRANSDYVEYGAQKSARMIQVQQEIAAETAKEVLDPGALGVRYAELEAIRRDLADQLQRTREKATAQLTEAQKTKLRTLDEARKLQGVIREAECTNLLAPLPALITGVISPVPPVARRLAPIAGGILPFPAGCLTFSPGPVGLPAQP